MIARRCSTCRHWDLHPWDSITPHCKNICTLLSERQRAIDGGVVLTSVGHCCDEWEERKPLAWSGPGFLMPIEGGRTFEKVKLTGEPMFFDEIDAWPATKKGDGDS